MSSANVPAGSRQDSSAVRFSTEAFPAHGRIAAWREFVGRAVMKLDVESLCDDRFHSDATLRAAPGLGVMSVTSEAMRFTRPRHLIDNDDFALSILLDGEGRLAACGREAVVRSGEAIMMGGAEGGTNEAFVACRVLSLRVPRCAISQMGSRLDDSICRAIPADTPALELLTNYLRVIEETRALGNPHLQHQVVAHVHDLIALTIGTSRDAAEVAQRRGGRAARLAAIKDDIAKGLGQPDCSISALAARHRCTPRYIQKLFDDEGVTFTEYLLAQRLARAHRMLSDPLRAGEKIASVARDAGFHDLSYFNSAFRKRYGDTPSGVRGGARAEGSQ